MNTQVFDAAVIGGGPAGTSAAIRMAQQGLKVLLLEAQAYPHDKLCGEFLTPECGDLLAALGVGPLWDAGAVKIHSARFTAAGGAGWETLLPGVATGISRKILDALLADTARRQGVTVVENSRVSEVRGSLLDGFELVARNGSVMQMQFARAVVGAYGKRSGLDRSLGRAFIKKDQPFIALKAHFFGPPVPERIELHAFPGGYCGISEIEHGRRNVCLLVRQPVFSAAGGQPEALIDWMQQQNQALRDWLRQAERIHPKWMAIAQVPFVHKQAVERDVLMTGDAAGLIVPLAGDGIGMALEGGYLVSHFLTRFLKGECSPEDLRIEYARAWKQRFGLRLRIGRALQPLLMTPQAAALMLRVLSVLPPVGQVLLHSTRGKSADLLQ
jgi:flavin-dependent dehydrogenase